MNKFHEFYTKIVADEEAAKEISAILEGKPMSAASDEQLEKIGAVAKRLGLDISLADARDFLKAEDKSLSDDDLDAVAGGSVKVDKDGDIIIDTRNKQGQCVCSIGLLVIGC